MKVSIITLGCKVNQYESDALLARFGESGFDQAGEDEEADICVINTCTVTHLGDRKSRQMIRRAIHQHPHALIVVTGCYAQVSPDEVAAIEGVDLIVGNSEKSGLAEKAISMLRKRRQGNTVQSCHAETAVSDIMSTRRYCESKVDAHAGKTRAFLKIQEGCSNFCSYCIVPYARGPIRSRLPENVIDEAKRFTEHGYREIVLTGIHLGAYGADLPYSTDLTGLLRQLLRIEGLRRLRLSSIDPHEVTEEMIEMMADDPVFCPHFHIPLQSGSDRMIRLMNRHYTCAEYADLVRRIRERIPYAAVTTDVIVGFPGESEADFEDSYAFIEAMAFSRLHVFKYSARQGTPAASFPGQVTAEDKEQRSRRLIMLNERLQENFARRFIGQEMEVLPEQQLKDEPGMLEGLTGNYLNVIFSGGSGLIGELQKVRISGWQEGSLRGEI